MDKTVMRMRTAKDLKIEEQASYIRLLKTQLEQVEEKLNAIREVFRPEQESECESCQTSMDKKITMTEEIRVCGICGCMWQEAVFDTCPVCRLRKKLDELESVITKHRMW